MTEIPPNHDKRDMNEETESQRLLSSLHETENAISEEADRISTVRSLQQNNWFQNLSLKTKTTVLAIALGTIPVVAIGAIAYQVASNSITDQVSKAEQTRAVGMSDKVSRFLVERFGDIKVLSKQAVFANSKLQASVSFAEKNQILDEYIKAYRVYDSIAVFDLQGNLIAKSKGELKGNHANRPYFQEALKTGQAVATNPEISKSTGKEVMHFAAPIKDYFSGQIVGVVRTRMPLEYLEAVISNFGVNGEEYHVADSEGKMFAASEKEQVGRNLDADFPNLASIKQTGKANYTTSIDKFDNAKQLIAYSPFTQLEGLPDLGWQSVIAIDTHIAFAARQNLLITFLLGTGVAAAAVAALSVFIADRATRPVLEAADAVNKIGRGLLDTRLEIAGEDELAQLGSNINSMASQLETLLTEQQLAAERAGIVKNIIIKLVSASNLDEILNLATYESRLALAADRVVYFSFKDSSNSEGKIITESIADGWMTMLDTEFNNAFPEADLEFYRQGRVRAIENIYKAGLPDYQLKQLEVLQVKANLIAPVQAQGQLAGLLIVHQCSTHRTWQAAEIELLSQVVNQVSNSLERENFLKQQKLAEVKERQERENLQRRALELLMEVDPVSRGDLTVRARVLEDEIGTIADSYNATIENLRKIVTQVQTAATQVANTTSEKDASVQQLSVEAIEQSEEILVALQSIEGMAQT
ncbi:MAG: HAMP domain-containing protein, partial [Xenococcaceae cyanobacterium]